VSLKLPWHDYVKSKSPFVVLPHYLLLLRNISYFAPADALASPIENQLPLPITASPEEALGQRALAAWARGRETEKLAIIHGGKIPSE
jgi:hypothetical protein